MLQTVGNAESPYKIEIAPKTAGRIEMLQAREGDMVQAGQVLLKIDPSDLKGAVLQQEAAVAEARSRLAQAKITQGATNVGVASQIQQQQAGLSSSRANLGQAQKNLDAQIAAAEAQVSSAKSALANAKVVLERENATLRNVQIKYDRTFSMYKQGFIAAQDVDDAKTAVDVQKSAVGVAQGQVVAAQSQLESQQQNALIVRSKGVADLAAAKAQETQSQATLRVAQANRAQTPAYKENLDALQAQVDAAAAQLQQAQARLSDTVIKSSIEGTVTARKADPGALASPGSPVLEVQYLEWLFVSAPIPTEAVGTIHEGQTANVTFDAMPGKVFKGQIVNLNFAADPQTRQFSFKVRLDNKEHALRPGMYARISVVTGEVDAKVVVPREAISTNSDGLKTVTVIDTDNVAHIQPVKLGATDNKGSEVLEGVQARDQIVVLTFNALKDGQKVTPTAPGASSKTGKSGKSRGGKGGKG